MITVMHTLLWEIGETTVANENSNDTYNRKLAFGNNAPSLLAFERLIESLLIIQKI